MIHFKGIALEVIIITCDCFLCTARASISLLILYSNVPAPQVLSYIELAQFVFSMPLLPPPSFRPIIELLFNAATLLRVSKSGM